MDYGKIGNSAVPHVTTLSTEFKISYEMYRNTLIIESSFIILVLPFLAIWIYFSTKGRKDKHKDRDRQDAKEHQPQSGQIQENHGEGLSQAHSITIDQHPGEAADSYHLENTRSKDNDKAWQRLQLIDRRLCYIVCFFAIHAVCVNTFDSSVISMVSFYLTGVIYLLFNLVRPKKTPILIGMYFIPVFVSTFNFWLGQHQVGVHQPA